MRINEPQSNHAGGTVAFGPDGYLYLSLGDGGAAGDVGVGHPVPGNGQDTSTLLGSILRIDVDHGDPYAIPPDNPFVGGHGADEIYAYGFRNPYRFSFDLKGNNQLFVGDAGQNLFEEVNIVEKGGNYGWRIMEGTHCFDVDNMSTTGADCPETGPDGKPLLLPIVEYSHDEVGKVVVGGYIYRGAALPELEGAYIFGDWSKQWDEPAGVLLAAVPPDGTGLWPWEEIEVANDANGQLNHYVLAFGQDADGEMYLLTKDNTGPTGNTGKVYKLVPPSQAPRIEATVEPTEAGPTPSPDVTATAGSEREATVGPAASPTASPTPNPAASPEATEVSGAAVTVEADSFYFEPKQFTIPAGAATAVEVFNEADIAHNFSIEPLNIDIDLQPDARKTITINAPAGEYTYYCDIANHRELGMEGKLIVKQP